MAHHRSQILSCVLSVSTLTVILLADIVVSDIPQGDQNENPHTMSWSNKTCKNIYCCIDGVMTGLDATEACLHVEGYGCHMRYQMQKFADTKCIQRSSGVLVCHRNIDDCSDDLGRVLMDTKDKDCADVEENLKPSLYCRRGSEGSLICEFSNTTTTLSSQCGSIGNSNCQYRKERVSCPDGWAPHRNHCYLYKEQSLSWDDAEADCAGMGDGSHLTHITREEENNFTSFHLLKALTDREHNIWWTGLRRIQPHPDDIGGHVFRWSDNTTFDPEGYKEWGIPSPETDVGQCVYVRNGQWFLDDCAHQYAYICKMPATVDEELTEDNQDPSHPYKSLYCRPNSITRTSPGYMTEESSGMMDKTEEDHTTMTPTEALPTTRNAASVELQVQMKASAQQVAAELDNVTRELGLPEDTQQEITNEINVVANVDDSEGASASAVEAIDNVMDLLANSISEFTVSERNTSEPIVIKTPSMVIQVYPLKKPKCEDNSISCKAPPIAGGVNDLKYTVALPEALYENGATLAMSTLDGLQDTMSTATTNDESGEGVTTSIGSLITSIALSRWDGEAVVFSEDDPLVLTFSNLASPEEQAERVCSYWEPSKDSWSSDGCKYNANKSSSTYTTCECTHLTSFAVLMQVMEVEQTSLPRALDYLTYIGCGLSIFCLLLMILIYLIQKMHRSDRNIIHINLALALLIAQIIFVIGIDQTSNKGLCKAVGACLHYFLLSTFFWMLNEAIFLLSKTTSARIKWLKMPLFLSIGWGLPVLVVAITLAAGFNTAYHTTNYCWLEAPRAIWAFVGPAALIILINTGILIKVIHTFLSLKANMNKKKKERIWLSLRAMLLTLPLLGTTWLIGIFSMNNGGTIVFAYVFVILNSLQGVFIFVLYCAMNDEVKKGLEKRMSGFSTGRSSLANSTPKSSKGSRATP